MTVHKAKNTASHANPASQAKPGTQANTGKVRRTRKSKKVVEKAAIHRGSRVLGF